MVRGLCRKSGVVLNKNETPFIALVLGSYCQIKPALARGSFYFQSPNAECLLDFDAQDVQNGDQGAKTQNL